MLNNTGEATPKPEEQDQYQNQNRNPKTKTKNWNQKTQTKKPKTKKLKKFKKNKKPKTKMKLKNKNQNHYQKLVLLNWSSLMYRTQCTTYNSIYCKPICIDDILRPIFQVDFSLDLQANLFWKTYFIFRLEKAYLLFHSEYSCSRRFN